MDMAKEYSFWSRKFVTTIAGLLLVSAVFFSTVWLPMLVGLYPTYVGAVIGILGVYMGGNVANKYVVGKQTSNLLQPTVDDSENEDSEEKES